MLDKLPSTTLPSSATVLQFQPRQSNGYLKLQHALLESSAWQSLPALPSALFPEIAGRHNGHNNGAIAYSVRDGIARFHVSDRSVRRAFTRLEESGVAVRTKRGTFDLKTREAKATEWFVPSLRTPQRPAADTTTTSDPLPADTTTTLLDKNLNINLRSSEVLSLPKQAARPSEDSPLPFPIQNPEGVPRAAAPGGVPRGPDEVLIVYDTPQADLAERFYRAKRKPFPRYGRAQGFYLPKAEWEAMLAAAEGALP